MKVFTLAAAFFTVASVAFADSYVAQSCNETMRCPEEYPCCSVDGICGTGNYCLQCNPKFSFNSTACLAMPVCKSGKTLFDDVDKLLDVDTYLGNSSESDWTYSGYVLDYENSTILAMPKYSGGTVISSTFYVWYGKVTTKFKSSHLGGVVSSSILYSNVQDEIDFEFIGSNLTYPQTNYYYEGVLNYTNMIPLESSDTFENWHTYEVDWTEDYITWSIDGGVSRTLNKNDTYNATDDSYYFPQTPSRIQLSIWPGGNSTSANGTKEWAGGEINWDAPDISDPGYYYAMLESIEVDCYDPPASTKKTGSKSYRYVSNDDFSEHEVEITDDQTWISSLGNTGFNPNGTEPEEESSSSSSSSFSSTSKSTTHTTIEKTIVSSNSTYLTTFVSSYAATEAETSTNSYSSGFLQNINSNVTSSKNGASSLSLINSLLAGCLMFLFSLF
ncbi:hypothetical protein B5S28_g366 [[Candida] boidinii]|uniref:Unnamed protein product n=1 Tax=Candida boidinii TaxID=5477 RepID=A0ACB5TF45_CANBO|nr:hypothetical protein B5S28_g366 [[Candida] boidinii]OWB59983.1 hypothetical protein B5S29_g848 [[Candida] boidinii]OWB71182.1 hypothetical protein B5S31_g867 [[Candida] boidinii]OWB76993.1 hypothetical protein B5S32_g1151 [[Candida] boidinii]GME87195.1 unnamed protein product [[Candida] boidinii]